MSSKRRRGKDAPKPEPVTAAAPAKVVEEENIAPLKRAKDEPAPEEVPVKPEPAVEEDAASLFATAVPRAGAGGPQKCPYLGTHAVSTDSLPPFDFCTVNLLEDGFCSSVCDRLYKYAVQIEYLHSCVLADTINRPLLDFDFEKVCSISLSNHNVYGCLVCGKFFSGRGQHTHAYTHSVQASHHVFINLENGKVYCLPGECHRSLCGAVPVSTCMPAQICMKSLTRHWMTSEQRCHRSTPKRTSSHWTRSLHSPRM